MFTFLHADSNSVFTVRSPESVELNIPFDVQPKFTMSGFFLPINAVDDLKASWVVSWALMTMDEIEVIQALEHLPLVTIEDPLGNPNTGYIDNFDFAGAPGLLEESTGKPLYSATMTFQLVHLEVPSYIPRLPASASLPKDSSLGVTRTGRPPLMIRGNSIHSRRGWFTLLGGEADPWADWDPPETSEWFRHVRTRHTPSHTIAARWLEVPANEIPAGRGSVFVGFQPLETGGVITWGNEIVTFDDNFTYG